MAEGEAIVAKLEAQEGAKADLREYMVPPHFLGLDPLTSPFPRIRSTHLLISSYLGGLHSYPRYNLDYSSLRTWSYTYAILSLLTPTHALPPTNTHTHTHTLTHPKYRPTNIHTLSHIPS